MSMGETSGSLVIPLVRLLYCIDRVGTMILLTIQPHRASASGLLHVQGAAGESLPSIHPALTLQASRALCTGRSPTQQALALSLGRRPRTMLQGITRLWRDEQGLTTVEYALLLVMSVVVAFTAWQTLGQR